MSIYFDYSATTPIKSEVLKEMGRVGEEVFGNPSSLHSNGQKAKAMVIRARKEVAGWFNSKMSEIVFTAGATEANNLVLRSIGEEWNYEGEIVSSSIEHHSVLDTLKWLESKGMKVKYIKPGDNGVIDEEKVGKAINSKTKLVSIMYVNNETGAINPVRAIGALCEAQNVPFHTDAVQAGRYLNMRADKIKCTYLTASAHKIYGPKGIGCLFVKSGAKLIAQITGGGQESGKRCGTENVLGIVGFGEAVRLVREDREKEGERIAQLSEKLWKGINKLAPETLLNGPGISSEFRVPGVLNIGFPGKESESLLMKLDIEDVCVSVGSACTSGIHEPSYVLLAMGIEEGVVKGSIRLSIGSMTIESEVDEFLEILKKVIN